MKYVLATAGIVVTAGCAGFVGGVSAVAATIGSGIFGLYWLACNYKHRHRN